MGIPMGLQVKGLNIKEIPLVKRLYWTNRNRITPMWGNRSRQVNNFLVVKQRDKRHTRYLLAQKIRQEHNDIRNVCDQEQNSQLGNKERNNGAGNTLNRDIPNLACREEVDSDGRSR